MFTKTRNGVTVKTPQKTTSSTMKAALVKHKKIRKIALQPEEEELENKQPLANKTNKVVRRVQNLMKYSTEEGAKLLSSTLKNKAIKEPSIVEVLMEQTLHVKANAKAILKEVEGTYGASGTQDLEFFYGRKHPC